MRMCPDHWSQLGDAVRARGMGDRIAASTVDAMERQTTANPCPLMHAHNVLLANAIGVAGADLADCGEGCPLCWLIDGCGCIDGDDCTFLRWPQQAADVTYAQLEHGVAHGARGRA